MTKEEFKNKFIKSGLLTWEKARDIDFDHMYNHLHYIDSVVAELFEVPLELVIKKRNALGISIQKDDYDAFLRYKQQGNLKWDELNYNRLDYLCNKCHFPDGIIAELFDVPKRKVAEKRKALGITMFDNLFGGNTQNNVSSYLDFASTEFSEK